MSRAEAPARPGRPARTQSTATDGTQEVYVVEEDEEDQLIDDDEQPAQSRGHVVATVASVPAERPAPAASKPPVPPQQTRPAPPPPAPASAPTPVAAAPPPQELHYEQYQPPGAPGSSTPKRRKGRKPADQPTMSVAPQQHFQQQLLQPPTILPGPAPANLDNNFIQTSAPIKKRRRTAIKATLEVERQEPETHDNTGTTSAWRLDSAGPAIQVGQMQMQMTIPYHPPAPEGDGKPAKRKRGPKPAASFGAPATTPIMEVQPETSQPPQPPKKRTK